MPGGIPLLKPPLLTPRAGSPKKLVMLKIEEHKLSQAPICELTYHKFASQIGLGHVNSLASRVQTVENF